MGLFDSFKQAKAESAGRVMLMQLQGAQHEIGSMSERMRHQVLDDFCQRRKNMVPRLPNMTHEGVVKAGIDFQIAGNKLRQTVPVEGYPLLLVGMWLESGCRPGQAAAAVRQFLDAVAC